MSFSLVWDSCFLEFIFQSFLIDLLQESRSKFCMNIHHTTFYFIRLISVNQISHITSELKIRIICVISVFKFNDLLT